MRVMLDPSQGQASATITVNNTRDQALPIEVRVLARHVEESGEQRFEPADASFVVFPPQALIEARQSQAIRIQYAGNPALEQSQAFVIEVQEVPVRPEGFTGVQFAYNFGVAVYVSAPDARSRLNIVGFERDSEYLNLRIENSGNDFAFTTHRSLNLVIDGERHEIDPQNLADLIDNPILPPGLVRTLRISIADLPTGTIDAVTLSRAR